MRITKGTDAWKLVAVMAAGAIVAAASFKVPKSFVSSAVIQVTPQPDPVTESTVGVRRWDRGRSAV